MSKIKKMLRAAAIPYSEFNICSQLYYQLGSSATGQKPFSLMAVVYALCTLLLMNSHSCKVVQQILNIA